MPELIRIQTLLRGDQLQALQAIRKRTRVSVAQILRIAVDEYLARRKQNRDDAR